MSETTTTTTTARTVDAHHNVARYGWELVDTAGTVALAGTDVAEFDADGAISRVLGFLGELAPRD